MTPEQLSEIRERAAKPCLERDSFGQTCGNEITCGPCVDRRRAAPSDVAALLGEVERISADLAGRDALEKKLADQADEWIDHAEKAEAALVVAEHERDEARAEGERLRAVVAGERRECAAVLRRHRDELAWRQAHAEAARWSDALTEILGRPAP